jgi:hypothetical protein
VAETLKGIEWIKDITEIENTQPRLHPGSSCILLVLFLFCFSKLIWHSQVYSKFLELYPLGTYHQALSHPQVVTRAPPFQPKPDAVLVSRIHFIAVGYSFKGGCEVFCDLGQFFSSLMPTGVQQFHSFLTYLPDFSIQSHTLLKTHFHRTVPTSDTSHKSQGHPFFVLTSQP